MPNHTTRSRPYSKVISAYSDVVNLGQQLLMISPKDDILSTKCLYQASNLAQRIEDQLKAAVEKWMPIIQ